MNQTSRETIITWKIIDGKPVVHVEVIQEGMSLKELAQLEWKLKQVYDEVDWHIARFLGAGMKNRGNIHILEKSKYEHDNQCAALCGKSIAWEVAFPLGTFHPHGKGVCKACSETWDRAQAEQGSEATHANN